MTFNILAIGQAGRLEHEAILLAASLRHSDPGFAGTLYIAEPQPGPKWQTDPRMSDTSRALLTDLGATILPFETNAFGSTYPYGNKIEALDALPDAPFLFLDSDTLITGPLSAIPFDFAKPSASMRREGTCMTGSGWNSKAPSTSRSPMNTGNAIFTSTRDGSFTPARAPLATGSCPMPNRSATMCRTNWSASPWTPGWIRWRCPW